MLLKLSIGFIAFLLIVILIEQIRKKISGKKTDLISEPEIQGHHPETDECCGAHETCEKELMLNALNKDIEYYDDEELDVYKGRDSDQYIDDEIEEFRDILYTMLESDVPGWLQSLQLRGIELPDELKDEAFMFK